MSYKLVIVWGSERDWLKLETSLIYTHKLRFAKLAAAGDYGKLAGAGALKPLLIELCQSGFKTVAAIRDELNRRKVQTFRGAGHVWHLATVYGLLRKF